MLTKLKNKINGSLDETSTKNRENTFRTYKASVLHDAAINNHNYFKSIAISNSKNPLQTTPMPH